VISAANEIIHPPTKWGGTAQTARPSQEVDAPMQLELTTGEVPYGFCHCGCGEKTRLAPCSDSSKGWIRGEPKRYVLHHHATPSGPRWIEQDCGHDTPCWIWQRSLAGDGYGRMGWALGPLAHRAGHLTLRRRPTQSSFS
jgi:hypothetical protein